MTYQELYKSHQDKFAQGGDFEYRELTLRIGALAFALTGEHIDACSTRNSLACVSKGTILKAAALLGFEYDGNFTAEAYENAHEFLGTYILNAK